MTLTPRRILFISGFFPPYAPIGAVRTGKLAQHWKRMGHDVRTIAIALPSAEGIRRHPDASVSYVPYREADSAITKARSIVKRWSGGGATSGAPRSGEPQSASPESLASKDGIPIRKLGLGDLYRQALQFPDRYKHWIKPAVHLAMSWQESWKPDVIYSSGPPHSGHIVAAHLSSRLGAHWVAELRDLWADDPYYDRHPLVRPLLERLARKTIGRASACVAVTDSAGQSLRSSFSKPVVVSYNGFDPEDFAGLGDVEPLDRDRLTIVHAGVIYLGRRDPSPLFKAIAMLGEQSRKVRAFFYHDANGSVAALARIHGIVPSVEIREAVPRSEILRVERQSDILLECRWLDPAGDGVIPGKLFEYVGARRPILSLGSPTGEAAQIVRDNNLGLVSNEPEEIAAMLRDALRVKERLGRLPDIEGSADLRFHRETQFRKIDDLIQAIVETPPRAG